MSELDNELLDSFIEESKAYFSDLIETLEQVESEIQGNFYDPAKLEHYGNLVDRVMGSAKNLALMAPAGHAMHFIGDAAALCKVVSYKASKVKNNPQLINICVALLLDVTEILELILDDINQSAKTLQKRFPANFIERLRWASEQFDKSISGTVSHTSSNQSQTEIDQLLKKLGVIS